MKVGSTNALYFILFCQLYFRKACDDNICNTDLHLDANLVFASTGKFFVMGSPSLEVHVRLTKDGDPSYGSVFHLIYPRILRFKNMKQQFGSTHVGCFLENEKEDNLGETKGTHVMRRSATDDDSTKLLCDFGNPLYNDTGVEFRVTLEVPTELPLPVLHIKLNATTLSNENQTSDNHLGFDIEIRNHVHMFLSG